MVHADALEDLRQKWPDWMIRRSPTRQWRATRRGKALTFAQIGRGLAETLLADGAEDLTEQLEAQKTLELELKECGS